MMEVRKTLARFKEMNGYANRILWVDLGTMKIEARETTDYVPHFLGARGIAAKICWEEYPEPVNPFSPESPLMIFTGALTGSPSPYSGRTSVCGFSPQAYPFPWFTRSNIGGYFGGELKRAGYDGIVIRGIAEKPVRIRIKDDDVSILPADDLWGKDIFDSFEALQSLEGKKVKSLVIGPAGENLSHIATIQTASSSAAGQGGFGAVMGSKKIKAISVIGNGSVSLKQPETVQSFRRILAKMLVKDGKKGINFLGLDVKKLNEKLAAEGGGKVQCRPCTESCITPCNAYFKDMPGPVFNKRWSGSMFCCAAVGMQGAQPNFPEHFNNRFDFNLSLHAGFEMNVLTNRYGLNQYELIVGMLQWLIACQKQELISDINGMAMDWSSPRFWAEFLRILACGEGIGSELTKGGWAAANNLNLGLDIAAECWTGWGQAQHWDGHDTVYMPFPFWLVSALQWMSDTRDPMSGDHGIVHISRHLFDPALMEDEKKAEEIVARLKYVGDRLYKSSAALDPFSGYEGKAFAGYFHTIRPIIKDCVPVDDFIFPLTYSPNSPTGEFRVSGIEGVKGDIEGPSVEYHLFKAGTGVNWSEDEFNLSADRVATLERAIQVRHWGRDRRTDEMILPYFEKNESYPSFYTGQSHGLDRDKFKPVVDEFYELKGWDVKTGWPTREHLKKVDLGYIYDPMIRGAGIAKKTQS